MELNKLKPPVRSRKKKKRVGRGDGSGHGGTSTRGHKGHRARAGGKSSRGFEGGQMPLQRRLPKRGFSNPFRQEWQIVNLKDLNRFPAGSVVDPALLKEVGLIKKGEEKVKVLGDGFLNFPLTIKAHQFSLAAKSKIEAVGGKAEVI